VIRVSLTSESNEFFLSAEDRVSNRGARSSRYIDFLIPKDNFSEYLPYLLIFFPLTQMSRAYAEMRTFYQQIFTPPFVYDISRKEEFKYRGKYHSANPLVEHRHAGLHPFIQIDTPDLIPVFPRPSFVFQNAPLHTPIAHTNNLDIIRQP